MSTPWASCVGPEPYRSVRQVVRFDNLQEVFCRFGLHVLNAKTTPSREGGRATSRVK